jgi:hypothetical protein
MSTPLEEFQGARKTAEMVSSLRQLYANGRIPESDKNFINSLLRAADNRGLSIKQAAWVDKLVDRFTRPPASAQTPVQLSGMSGVVALLTKARENGLKFPKLWLKLPLGDDLRITIAGERSKTPGFLVLTDGEAFGSNRYYGRISPDGQLTIGKDGHVCETNLVELLMRLGQDPARVAAEFGHLTGHCCFCSLQLTDERSTVVGYGRICAGKFGLPWGKSGEQSP